MIFLSKNHLTLLLAYYQSELEAVEKGIDLNALEIAIEVFKKKKPSICLLSWKVNKDSTHTVSTQ